MFVSRQGMNTAVRLLSSPLKHHMLQTMTHCTTSCPNLVDKAKGRMQTTLTLSATKLECSLWDKQKVRWRREKKLEQLLVFLHSMFCFCVGISTGCPETKLHKEQGGGHELRLASKGNFLSCGDSHWLWMAPTLPRVLTTCWSQILSSVGTGSAPLHVR